jgi:hypothetical protein
MPLGGPGVKALATRQRTQRESATPTPLRVLKVFFNHESHNPFLECESDPHPRQRRTRQRVHFRIRFRLNFRFLVCRVQTKKTKTDATAPHTHDHARRPEPDRSPPVPVPYRDRHRDRDRHRHRHRDRYRWTGRLPNARIGTATRGIYRTVPCGALNPLSRGRPPRAAKPRNEPAYKRRRSLDLTLSSRPKITRRRPPLRPTQS